VKLDFVEICGFRGFRDKVRINFGSGFTVISGRNGVGKSTICDAFEFVLTGTIEKYTVEKSAQETLHDYLWWRGSGKADEHYVTAGFKKLDGETFSITRSRESGANKSPTEIEQALCFKTRPDDSLRQLCRTSIIRDEWIAALSVDLTEIERFELVRSALGLGNGASFGDRAKAVLKASEVNLAAGKVLYEKARTQLTNALTELSETRESLGRVGDVSDALEVLVAATSNASDDLISRLAAGRTVLAKDRIRLTAIGEAITLGRDIQAIRRKLETPEARAIREDARTHLEHVEKWKKDAESCLEDAVRLLAIEEHANSIAASLATIIEHGQILGRHDEHCPLCAAERTSEEFSIGLARARARMQELASGIDIARQNVSDARIKMEQATSEFKQAEIALLAIEVEWSQLHNRENGHVELLEQNDINFQYANDLEGLEKYLIAERDRLINLERAMQTLEVSQSALKLASLEERVESLRNSANAAADELENFERAYERSRAMDRAVRSISGEIIDERLAQISPLLNELYQRLRPHNSWKSIEYSIRGDLRRFLSLKVGDGLNPQFVFSSGQRRAAGLAFLLSVHLARAWTPLQTLLLDDPVQHIDDFRALHLIEVLAALSLDKRQIICAVEDAALAELLCRRLNSTSESIGKHYSLDVGSDGATSIVSDVTVPPMPAGVLRARSAIQVVDR
jgi:chromosome segregation protein